MSEKNDNKVPNVPNLRFIEYNDSWQKYSLKSFTKRVTRKNVGQVSKKPLTISARYGLIDQSEFFDRQIASKDMSGYYLLKNGEFAYNKSYSNDYPLGAVKRLDKYDCGALSTLYICFSLDTTKVNSDYLSHYFETNKWHKGVSDIAGEGARNHGLLNMSVEDYFLTRHYLPSLREQEKISHFLNLITTRIETQSKIIEDFETLRKWIINQQFTRTATNAIGEFIEQTSERNKTNCVDRVLSVSNKYGFINQSEQFEDREVASDNRTNYKIVRRNDFAFNPARINVGSIAKLDTYDIGIVSPMYICFKSNNKNLDVDYLSIFFSSNSFKNALNKRLEGSVRQCLQFDALCDIKLFVPSLDEQISFVSKIKAITEKLIIEKDILSAYKKQKAYLLSNMFI